jgi:hypothetical protein
MRLETALMGKKSRFHSRMGAKMNFKMVMKPAAVAATVFVGAHVSGASALESIVPYLPGASIGVPIGALPPPGFYFSQTHAVFDIELKDNRGQPTGIKISDLAIAPQLLWVSPDKVLGATYGAFIIQPFRRAGTDVGGQSLNDFRPINTIFSPVNLSWELGGGFFASAGLSFYTGAWSWNRYSTNNAANNYWTVEPSVGISYLANGWNISAHGVIDFNSRNNVTKYQSGDVFILDYTASRAFGKWDLGLGGTLIEQITDDKIDGIVAPAIPGIRGRGGLAHSLNIGPVVGYSFGDLAVKAYFLREIYAYNVPGGNRFYLRVSMPLSSSYPPGPGGPDAAGPH